MPAPRLSQSEAARAAALQAEFNEKKWVWVPDEKEGYLAGWVNKEEGDEGEIVMAVGGDIRRVPLYALSKMNPPKFDRVEDIADLTFLNEASVVHNLRLRYGSGAIYTYSGLFLVAINPYQSLPLYSDAIVQQYRNKRRDENPPHIFAVAERAWISMGEERENQSILITGESGAGKTESTKKVIQFLAAIATDVHPRTPSHSHSPSLPMSTFALAMPTGGSPTTKRKQTSTSISHLTAKDRLGLLERQILQANPILEAFGNAQTQRNNNSSRFGKFIRITFAPDGSIAGANIDWYLLEKSRVVVRSEAERSFHVFYQLMAGGRDLQKPLLLDGGIENYEYLNKSRREVDGIDDKEEWATLRNALDVVGFSDAEQLDLFRIVAAIMHIGNITITSTRADDAVMPDPSQAERVCYLLGIPVPEFTRAVLRPRVLAGREWVSQARTKQQAQDELAALCKTLYEKSFSALVDRINRALDRPSSKTTFIGVLDIAGFEIFEINAYEQLLINYTNEKLQQFFNHHMFVLEQEEYTREGIEWDYVNFGLDLQPTIDLIEASGNVIGVLSCMDEECIMPKATDLTFTNKLNQMWSGDVQFNGEDMSPVHPGREKYEPSRFEQGFIIQHYAGKVEYRTEGWLAKNKDPLNDNLTRVLASSSEHYVATLFAEYGDAHGSGPQNGLAPGKKRVLKKGAFRTVAQRHKEQLSSLMTQLQATQPHFVRCIVPNGHKKPGRIDIPLVLDQLRCNGVLEGIRIARLGYPNRLPFVEFRQRYEVLAPGIIPRGYMDGRKACLRMVDALELDKSLFRVGTSKIFFKAGVLAELEERRDALLFDIFSRLQAVARRWTARRQMRKILNRAVAVGTIQRNARVYGELRDWPWWQLYTKVRPLLAATRNDEELRKKEVELALIKERAERDKQEREALQNLKMTLETQKRKIEEELEAERMLTLDKDALLERSKKREAELVEEVSLLQADLETLDSQLDRAMKIQKEGEEKYESLRRAFDDAAEHLVRLEREQKERGSREVEIVEQLNMTQAELEKLSVEKESLQKLNEDLKNGVSQREEDLARVKERMNLAIADLNAKLTIESRQRESIKEKAESLEHDSRQAKEQLAELARTATDYSSMLQKKEDTIAQLESELAALKREGELSLNEINKLQADIDTLHVELEALKGDRERSMAMRGKLQEELDELRALMKAKTTEDTRRNEVERSKDAELADLRQQVSKLQKDLSVSRKSGLEGQNKLKVELESLAREHQHLLQSHASLVEREKSAQDQLNVAQTNLADLEKTKRSYDSELLLLRSRHNDLETQLAQALRARESSERQLDNSKARCRDFEDTVLQLERDKNAHDRQLETARLELQTESGKRAKLEQIVASQRSELSKVKDAATRLDRDLKKALADLKNREWEVKQLEGRQDKTIVEHVHVLEEAKKLTDRQLAEAQEELEKNAVYIRSLEKAKTRLTHDAEDVARETERERVEWRQKEKSAKALEIRATRAMADADRERQAREAAEHQSRRLLQQLQEAKDEVLELAEGLNALQRSKDNLELELGRLADETDAPNSLAKFQRQYESRIAQLESQLDEAQSSQTVAAKVKEQVDRHHAELRKLILNHGNTDEAFSSRLLRELQQAEDRLEKEFSLRSRPRGRQSSEFYALANVPARKQSKDTSGNQRIRKSSHAEPPRNLDQQVNALKAQVQVLELQMVASDRVRRHLEALLRDIMADLENSDGSKKTIQQHRARLAKENAKLAELLKDEAQARRAAEAAQIDGVQAMWTKFHRTIAEERESYSRLEESRKALVVQQRTLQGEVETHRLQAQELAHAKRQLQTELSKVQEQLNVEIAARNEEINTKRKLQQRLQEFEITSTSSSAANSELQASLALFKDKVEQVQQRLEVAEVEKAKAVRAEAFLQRSLADAERTRDQLQEQKKVIEHRLQTAERKALELQSKSEEDGRDTSELDVLQQRLAEELEDERAQHQKDIAERDFTADQTRKKYQAELAQLSEELQSQRDMLSRLREDNRKLRSDYDDLRLQYDDEVYNGGAWKKEKERYENKIDDINKAYEASTAAQAEQQAQIVNLHTQVRELRGVLNDAESDRVLLQKARRALEAELTAIRMDHSDASRLSSDRELQKLQLKKQDLERSLEEQEDRVAMAFDRMKKAEAYVAECQVELGKVRVENSELERLNAHLEKQVKELNVRIIDLETKSYTNSSRPPTLSRRRESRIEELTNQLNLNNKDKTDSLRSPRSPEKGLREQKAQQAEVERQRQRLEEERNSYESQIESLRQALDALRTEESNLQRAKRRAEREAVENKQKALSLEQEVERLRGRPERTSMALLDRASPANSPRKFVS